MSHERLSILLVEDNPGDVRLLQEVLREVYGSAFELEHRSSLARALAYLSKATPDVVVVDLGLPDATGMEVIGRTRDAAPGSAVVVLTSRDDESVGLQALQEGAQDYLIKGELEPRLFSRAMRYAIERHRMQAALQSESLIDELTKLYNRRGFLALAGNHLKTVERAQQALALVFIDLDGMKQINDAFGHQAGDRALVEAAAVLKGCIRDCDILARFGGDEFVILVTAAERDCGAIIRKRIQSQLDAANTRAVQPYSLSFSVGVATASTGAAPTLERLLAQADAHMYAEKQMRRCR